jgi:hypothetical protein
MSKTELGKCMSEKRTVSTGQAEGMQFSYIYGEVDLTM